MRHIFFSCLIFLVISCKKNALQTKITPGIYAGSYQRLPFTKTSSVTLQFTTNSFTGQSDSFHYPDICNGNFSTSSDSVTFNNSCIFTADFDWSYILSGKYKFYLSGDSLFINRYQNGIIYYEDNFKLKKQ